jgi:2'-5' RNA ligase
MRVFAALPLPPAQVSRLEELSTELCRRYRRLKPVRREGFHITLLFWADLPGERVRLLEMLLDEPQLSRRTPIAAVLGKLGQFPPRGNPRVIFRHIEQGSGEITAFQGVLTEGVRGLGAGFPLDSRSFSPHVTLARNRGELMEPAGWQNLAAPGEAFEIDRCVLYRSELMPRGPLYTPLKTIMFDGSA